MDDHQQIIDLTIAYAWALDTKQLDQLHDVFAADATAMLRGVECSGVESIVSRIGGSILRLDATQHFIGNHHVTVDGDGASSRCQLQSQHVKAGVEGGDTYMIGGHYHDQLARTPAGWRITHRIMAQTWATGNPMVTKR
jgi:3-phenylpropionate/cinnamic acid dioxygenase small subunit